MLYSCLVSVGQRFHPGRGCSTVGEERNMAFWWKEEKEEAEMEVNSILPDLIK